MRLAHSLLQSYVKDYLNPASLVEDSGVSDPLLFSDTFTDTDGTLLTAHTPDVDTVGTGWVLYAGGYDIQSNKANTTVPGDVAADVGESDVIIEATGENSSVSGVIARLSDVGNYWTALLNGILYEKIGGVFTERADMGAPAAPPNTLSLECSGSSITFNAQSGLSVTYASATANQTETKHGLRGAAGSIQFDNFSVNSL